jgi:hypothetical protein
MDEMSEIANWVLIVWTIAPDLLRTLAESPPIQRWKEYEQRIPCYIQVETARAIAEFFSEPPRNSGGDK